MEKNKVDRLETLRDKYVFLSRYLKTPIAISQIKFWIWVGLIFSAFSTAYLIHWGLTAPLFYTIDNLDRSFYVIQGFGFTIVWPVYLLCLLVGMQFSVALYTSTYDTISEKVHDRTERKSRKWYQVSFIHEVSLDVLFIRLTGIAGMMMISYGAVQNFNDALAKDAEIRTADKGQLSKYENTAGIEDRIDFWTQKQTNGKEDDDIQADSMLSYYNRQLILYNHRADSLRGIVYNKAEIKQIKTVDATASIKFVSKGDKVLSGFILLALLGIIAAANDGGTVRLTRVRSRYDQAVQAQKMYIQERNMLESLIGNQNGNESGKWMESGSASNLQQDYGRGGSILDNDSAEQIIYAYVKAQETKTFKSNRKLAKSLGYSHSWVNDVLNAWKGSKEGA